MGRICTISSSTNGTLLFDERSIFEYALCAIGYFRGEVEKRWVVVKGREENGTMVSNEKEDCFHL
jgi:hypothetical protein